MEQLSHDERADFQAAAVGLMPEVQVAVLREIAKAPSINPRPVDESDFARFRSAAGGSDRLVEYWGASQAPARVVRALDSLITIERGLLAKRSRQRTRNRVRELKLSSQQF